MFEKGGGFLITVLRFFFWIFTFYIIFYAIQKTIEALCIVIVWILKKVWLLLKFQYRHYKTQNAMLNDRAIAYKNSHNLIEYKKEETVSEAIPKVITPDEVINPKEEEPVLITNKTYCAGGNT